MMLMFILISSLEELKDLSDKPEVMDTFLTKLESVSKQFIALNLIVRVFDSGLTGLGSIAGQDHSVESYSFLACTQMSPISNRKMHSVIHVVLLGQDGITLTVPLYTQEYRAGLFVSRLILTQD